MSLVGWRREKGRPRSVSSTKEFRLVTCFSSRKIIIRTVPIHVFNTLKIVHFCLKSQRLIGRDLSLRRGQCSLSLPLRPFSQPENTENDFG